MIVSTVNTLDAWNFGRRLISDTFLPENKIVQPFLFEVIYLVI